MARNVISGHLQTEMTYLVIHLKPEMTYLVVYLQPEMNYLAIDILQLVAGGGSTPKFNTNNAKTECQFGIGLVNYNVFYLWSCPNAMSPKTDWLYYFCLVCPIVFQYIIDFCWQTLPKSWQTNFGLAMTYKN